MRKFTTKLWLAGCLLNLLPLNVRAGDMVGAVFAGLGLAFTVIDIACGLAKQRKEKRGGNQ